MKIMVLLLIAIFNNGGMDSDAYVGLFDKEACLASGRHIAEQWKSIDSSIVGVMVECFEHDDPREILPPDLLPQKGA